MCINVDMSMVFEYLWICYSIIVIFFVIGLILFFKYSKEWMIKMVIGMVAMALFQTIIFMGFIFAIERLFGLMLVVESYNTSLLYVGELAMFFFILSISIDLLTEISRKIVVYFLGFELMIIRAIFVSLIQLGIYVLILLFLYIFNVISFRLYYSSGFVEQIWFVLYLFVWILISEVIIEKVRSYID